MSSNTVFTRKDTNIAKGIAVLFMLYHHLFAFNRIQLPYFTLLPSHPISFLKVLSEFGTICISIFLFLSGYGLYHVSLTVSIKDWSLSHLKHFLLRYFLIFFLFIPIGFFFFHITFKWNEFIMNLLCIQSTYNKEWWFVPLYAEILLLSPFFVRIVKKSSLFGGTFSFILCGIGLFIRFNANISSPLFIQISQFLNWQLLFIIGCLAVKHKWYEFISSQLIKHKWNRWYIYGIIILFSIILRQGFPFPDKVKDPLITPLFIYICVAFAKCLHLDSLFVHLGKHAANIWLVHTFFCYYYFSSLIYLPRFVPLIFIWLVTVSLGSSYGINFIEKCLQKGYFLCRQKKIFP